MKSISVVSLFLVLILASNVTFLPAQNMAKSTKTVYVERLIHAPAERVWQALVGDYGEISHFAPSIYASNYEAGSLKGEIGAERKCYFNEKGDRWSHETIQALDNQAMEMKNVVLNASKFPLDTDNSFAMYRVRDNGDGTSTASYEFTYRAKPGFMTGLVKGQFKKQLNETLIGLEHYVTTGEKVNATTGNWKDVKASFKDTGAYQGTFVRS